VTAPGRALGRHRTHHTLARAVLSELSTCESDA